MISGIKIRPNNTVEILPDSITKDVLSIAIDKFRYYSHLSFSLFFKKGHFYEK